MLHPFSSSDFIPNSAPSVGDSLKRIMGGEGPGVGAGGGYPSNQGTIYTVDG